jgi:hypothetical protein
MKLIFLTVFLLSTTSLTAQIYKESLLAPGLDPLKVDMGDPLTNRDKLRFHVFRAIGNEALAFDIVSAGFDQWRDTPPEWGRGAEGYAKRFGAQAGSKAVREMMGFGMDAVMHKDPRFYRSTKSNVVGRLGDALSQVLIARTDSGKHVFAVSNVSTAFAAGGIQTLWMPRRQANVGDGLVNGSLFLMGDAARDVFREFWPDVRHKVLHRD